VGRPKQGGGDSAFSAYGPWAIRSTAICDDRITSLLTFFQFKQLDVPGIGQCGDTGSGTTKISLDI
jgi:hypothetical protein